MSPSGHSQGTHQSDEALNGASSRPLRPLRLLRPLAALRTVVLQGQGPVLLFAAVVAVSMLAFYVNLLHDSLARGEQLREVQRISAPQTAAQSIAARKPKLPARAGMSEVALGLPTR